jgi:hypothetical protein
MGQHDEPKTHHGCSAHPHDEDMNLKAMWLHTLQECHTARA